VPPVAEAADPPIPELDPAVPVLVPEPVAPAKLAPLEGSFPPEDPVPVGSLAEQPRSAIAEIHVAERVMKTTLSRRPPGCVRFFSI